MAKTGQLAAFKLGEAKTAMVNLPAQFVTAKSANSKEQRYSKLVDYANNTEKIDDNNNASVTQVMDLKEQFDVEGYATRSSATTEQEPIFSSDKLHYNNHDISILRQRLDKAQDNGNNIHELAFSLRGDWLVKNKLYDPETRLIDQDKLKHAQQEVAEILINKGFVLPLGENEQDVVWFGVIHQDTDHLNMHLWFAKESKETRPEMLKQSGPHKGEPTGVIPLDTIELAKRHFRNQLMTNYERQKRTDVLKNLGHLKKEIISSSGEIFEDTRYIDQIKAIYHALPKDQKSRWQVGNSTLTATNTKMSKANYLTNQLLDDFFQNKLHAEYSDFKQLGRKFDEFNVEDQGVMRKGQTKLSDNKDAELRKQLANKLYRYLGQIEDNELEDTDKKIKKVKSRMKERSERPNGNTQNKSSLKRNRIQNKNSSSNHNNATLAKIPSEEYTQSMPKNNHAISKISRLWRQDIRADTNAERKFLRNQRKVEREQKVEELETLDDGRHRTI
ncbi:relaxase MobL [Leuconostoc citreum]|uniref:MobP2 family relaxase n=1 Tax=Leuconostoc citreum TaxID=33964 RepID=UPI00200AE396|nr:MobP2 family relaxase [Leuconostoc citreum]MCK8605762.1 relaxase MobL [Leuconostoc citreum]